VLQKPFDPAFCGATNPFSNNILKNKKCNMRKTRNDIETNDKSEKKIFLNELMI